MLIGIHDFGTAAEPRYLLFGVTHRDVEQLSIAIAADDVLTLERGSGSEPSIHIFGQNPNVDEGVWWVELPPGPVAATILALDATCERLGRATVALESDGTAPTAIAACVGGP